MDPETETVMFARIEDGRVAELIRFDPEGCFEPSLVWLAVPAELRPWIDTTFVVVDGALSAGSVEAFRGELLARLADLRWQKEVGGTKLSNGASVPTDRTTQGKITAGYVKADKNPAYTIKNWKFPDGQFAALDAATIILIGDAIEAHVQACFDREAVIAAALAGAGTTAALIAVFDAETAKGWPE